MFLNLIHIFLLLQQVVLNMMLKYGHHLVKNQLILNDLKQ